MVASMFIYLLFNMKEYYKSKHAVSQITVQRWFIKVLQFNGIFSFNILNISRSWGFVGINFKIKKSNQTIFLNIFILIFFNV